MPVLVSGLVFLSLYISLCAAALNIAQKAAKVHFTDAIRAFLSQSIISRCLIAWQGAE